MKIVLIIIASIIICVLAQSFIPLWWIFAPITFVAALITPFKTGLRSFFVGVLIVFVSWMILYLFKDMANDSVMSNKMANLFSVKSNIWLFIIASTLMGLVGGLTALSGYFFRKR